MINMSAGLLPSIAFIALNILAANTSAVAGVWGQRAPMLEANSEFAVAEVNGEIYILGGYPASRETQRTVQIYNIEADSWRIGPELPEPNNHGAASVIDGIIYLIGGQTEATSNPEGAGFLDSVWALDPAMGEWVARSPMPTRRGGHVNAVIDGKIYVAGGRPPGGADFAVYDPAADRWESLPDFPAKSNHMAAAAIDGKVYIAGGRLGGNYSSGIIADLLIYDPSTRTWEHGTPLPSDRSGNNGVLAFGCFHVWGGESAEGMIAHHDLYDSHNQTWTSLAPMPIPVHGVTGAAFYEGVIYIPGGGTEVGGSSGSLINQTYTPSIKCEAE
jgi:N-acetylneuraminic acid mutarotase